MVLKAVDSNHGFQQSREERYTAELVNQSGETVQDFAVDVKRSRNGRRVELSVRDSIPATALERGTYLRLSYPLSANGSSVLLQQPNLRGDGEAVALQSGQTSLAIAGTHYQYDALPAAFRADFACLLYRSVEEREDGKYTANLYLTPENSAFLTRIPEELSLARDRLNSLKKLGDAELSGDGVEVLYRYTTQFQATEAASARDALELQCQLRLRYPTQIRITESDKTEMTQDVSQELTTEAQTELQQTTANLSSSAAAVTVHSEAVTQSETSQQPESSDTKAQRETSTESRTATEVQTETQTVGTRPDPTESAAAATTEESGSEAESSTETETKKRSVRYITKPGGTRHRGGRQETSVSDTLPYLPTEQPTKPEESSTAAPTRESTRESTAASSQATTQATTAEPQPETKEPTTAAPTTTAPSTASPTKEELTTEAPTTAAPTEPTTAAPTEPSTPGDGDMPNPNNDWHDHWNGDWNNTWRYGTADTDWLR